MFTVTVLTPMGRRQQVKVTANTTILQILEEVCGKHGFNAQQYDLRHHNKVLDVSAMFRFTNLPNNAQLEMAEVMKQRQESPVTLGLQFESGERLTGVFSPSDSIWNVIVNLKPGEEKSSNLVVVYMRQEIYGKENLKTTTLRSLGLTSGRAMLRVLHKSPEELHTQANVSTVLPPRAPVQEVEEKLPKEKQKSPEVKKKELPVERPRTPSPKSFKEKPVPPSPEPVKQESTSSKYEKTEFTRSGSIFEKLLKDEKTKKSLLEGSRKKGAGFSKESGSGNVKAKNVPETKLNSQARQNAQAATVQEEPKAEAKVILLGERNAVAYNLDSVKPTEFEEEPDDFYDLTISDAQLLLKQAKQLCADLEEAPLMTSAQRELERDKKILSLLHQYKKTVLRVKFPDRTVLQGTFSPLETVSAVEKFVSGYLETPKLEFYLYTTPPKVILKPEDRLIECGCVPCSVLYFGMPTQVTPPSQYLKTGVLEKLSSPSAAALTAYQSRGIERKLEEDRERADELAEEAEKRKWVRHPSNPDPGPSGSSQWENKPSEWDQESSPQFKVPKWFRTNK